MSNLEFRIVVYRDSNNDIGKELQYRHMIGLE